MYLRTLFCVLIIGYGLSAHAQNDADAQRYSSDFFFGTARFNSLGGAMGALGGDMSATHINPAGIGVYRFGTISFTPAVESNTLESDIEGSIMRENVTKLVVNNVGVVLVNEIKNPYWRTFNYGISYNRLNTFNDKLATTSTLPINESLMHDFANEADGTPPENLSDYSSGLAWDGYIIDRDTLSTGYDYYEHVQSGDIKQVQTAERNGNLSETSLNFGTNYNDIFYIGASINFQSVKYRSVVETSESPIDQAGNDLINYIFREELSTDGLGVNFRLGGIVKAGKIIRFGASFQTPTTFSLTDNFQNSLDSKFRDPTDRFTPISSLGVFEYRIRTPWRFMGSAAAVFGKKGLLSFQYEFSNFGGSEIKNSNSGNYNADYSYVNQVIQESYTNMNVFRIGAEYRFTESFYGRGGFAYFSNPNKANEFGDANLNRFQYSGGIGFRKAIWNIDFSYQLATLQEQYLTNYSAPNGVLTDQYSNFALTLGIRL